MAYEPKIGDVIRYDFLWKEEERQGRIDGAKDRPCAVVLASKETEDGSRRLYLAPITHSPAAISDDSKGVEIPAKVSRHLGLDDEKSWIKTNQLNELIWPKDQIPVGVVPTKSGAWTYGRLPQDLGKQVYDGVRHHAQAHTIETVKRDLATAIEDVKKSRPKRDSLERGKSKDKDIGR